MEYRDVSGSFFARFRVGSGIFRKNGHYICRANSLELRRNFRNFRNSRNSHNLANSDVDGYSTKKPVFVPKCLE